MMDYVYFWLCGGKYGWDNVVIVCCICNQCKGNLMFEEVGMLLYVFLYVLIFGVYVYGQFVYWQLEWSGYIWG